MSIWKSKGKIVLINHFTPRGLDSRTGAMEMGKRSDLTHGWGGRANLLPLLAKSRT